MLCSHKRSSLATNYYAAPAQVNNNGIIIGHSHVTVESISDFKTKTVLDPNVFAFFKGLNLAADNGILSADVTGGLPVGSYRLCSVRGAVCRPFTSSSCISIDKLCG